MPKIGTFETKIDGTYTRLTIWYKSSEGFSFRDLPERVLRTVGQPVLITTTEDGLREEGRRIINEYHEIIKTERKVIGYSIALSTAIAMNKTEHGYEGYQQWVPKNIRNTKYNEDGYGFAINYRVLIEIEQNGKKYIDPDTRREVRLSSQVRSHSMIIIDWTEEREETLKQIKIKMKEMIMKIATAMADEEAFINMLQQGNNLLNLPEGPTE